MGPKPDPKFPWLPRREPWQIELAEGWLPQRNDAEADPIVVLGAPRTGTSMAAGIVYRLGVMMGIHLEPPGPHNPKGYYEDQDIQRALDLRNTGVIDDVTLRTILYYHLKLRQSIGVRWGIKNLRLINMLELMIESFSHLKIILTSRNPENAIESNAKASIDIYDLTSERAKRKAKVLSAETYQENMGLIADRRELFAGRTLVVGFDAMLSRPVEVTCAIANLIGIEPAEDQVRGILEYVG